MKFRSQVYTAVSGSIGGLTYSHNKGGMYTRGRATPTNPNTARQQNARNAIAQLSSYWTTGLSQAERDAWNLYAEQVLVPGAFGEPIQISGVNQFVRANAPRLNANTQLAVSPAFPITEAAPTVFDLPVFDIPSSLVLLDTGEATVNFDDTADWVNDDDSALLVYYGRPRNVSVAYFDGPYRLGGMIRGDNATPPTSPATIGPPGPWPFTMGQRVTCAFQLTAHAAAIQPSGLSSRLKLDVVVTT